MKQLNEFLIHKFREMDEVKNAVKDSVAYLKLYTPMMTQMQINENIQNLLSYQTIEALEE